MRFSIRFKVLAGVVIVNLLGAIITMVYLHQAYSGGVAQTATLALSQGNATWTAVQTLGGNEIGDVRDPKAAAAYVAQMKQITGEDYALLLDKQTLDPAAYAKAREAAGMANNFDEGTTYVTAAVTAEDRVKDFQFGVTPESVPEIGKLIGVKNGACSKLCHDTVKAEGDYWGVAWSERPGVTEANGVVPVLVDNKPIGVLYSIQDLSAQADAAKTSMLQTLAVIGVTLFAATLLIGMMIDIWVFKRLRNMTLAIEDISMRVAGGDFDARFEPDGTDDEIGEFEAFFARFMDLISATLKSLAG